MELGSVLPVVDELTRRGWKNKRWITKKGTPRGGSAFDKNSVYALLTNPLYVGKIKHKDQLYDGEHEPIIDSDVFDKVRKQLAQNSHGKGNHLVNKYGALLKGLLRCQACGAAMAHTFSTRGSKQYRYYTCTRAIKRGRKTCPTGSLSAPEIESVVVDQLRCIGQDAVLRDEVLRQAQSQSDADLEELETQQRQLERQLKRDHDEIRSLVTVTETSSATTARIADLHGQIASAELTLKQACHKAEEVRQKRIDEQDIAAAFADFDNVWNALNTREQVQVLELLVD
ncbi:MAG: recombinase zinc beta ribbon domain-containing protein, partial [Pirellulales bacterium]